MYGLPGPPGPARHQTTELPQQQALTSLRSTHVCLDRSWTWPGLPVDWALEPAVRNQTEEGLFTMSKIKTPLVFRKHVRKKCLSCPRRNQTDKEVCQDQSCAWYPFRFGKVYKRPLDRRMKESLVAFDFDAEWDRVKPLLNDPLALRALNAGMTEFCDQIGSEWEPEAGPWCHGEHSISWHDNALDKFNDSGRIEELDQWCPKPRSS